MRLPHLLHVMYISRMCHLTNREPHVPDTNMLLNNKMIGSLLRFRCEARETLLWWMCSSVHMYMYRRSLKCDWLLRAPPFHQPPHCWAVLVNLETITCPDVTPACMSVFINNTHTPHVFVSTKLISIPSLSGFRSASNLSCNPAISNSKANFSAVSSALFLHHLLNHLY